MAPILEDKDEYRLYYRILKAEEAMLRGEWESVSQYICGYAETGAIVLQIGKHIIPKPIQYQIAIDLYTDKGDLYSEIATKISSRPEVFPPSFLITFLIARLPLWKATNTRLRERKPKRIIC